MERYLLTKWIQNGFTEHEASKWSFRGFTLDEALSWKQHGFDVVDASCFKSEEMTPEEAKSLVLNVLREEKF